MAAGWGFGRPAGAGFTGVRCRHIFPVAGLGAAGALAVAGAPVVGTDLGARVDGVAHGLGVGVLEVQVEEVVVVVAVVESDAEQADVGDSGGSETAVAGASCWVLWTMMVRVWLRASGVCAPFAWRPVCMQVLVLWVVSCVVPGGGAELSWMSGVVSYPAGVHFSLDQVPQERHGSDFFLLPPGLLVDQASRTKEKGSNYPEITSENASNQQMTLSSVHGSLSHSSYSRKTV